MIRFRLFGIPCEISVSFWVWMALFGLIRVNDEESSSLQLGVWVLCGLISILAHELGHALMAQHYGVRPNVLLYSFGGLTFLSGGRLTTRPQNILISLAGPAVGLMLYGLVSIANTYLFKNSALDLEDSITGFVATKAIEFLSFMNLYWTLLNLLPVLPLDGGQVLRELLGPRYLSTTRMVGAVCALATGLYFLWHRQIFAAVFFGSLALSNFTGDTRSFTGGVQRG